MSTSANWALHFPEHFQYYSIVLLSNLPSFVSLFLDSSAVSLSTNSETAMLSMCRWRRCRLWFWRQCGVLCLVKCAVKPQTRLRQRTPPTAVRLQITESQNCQVTASHDTNLVASPVFSNQSYKTLCPFLSRHHTSVAILVCECGVIYKIRFTTFSGPEQARNVMEAGCCWWCEWRR